LDEEYGDERREHSRCHIECRHLHNSLTMSCETTSFRT
jgi:hypothetical protein